MDDKVEAIMLELVQSLDRDAAVDSMVDAGRMKSLRHRLETSPQWDEALTAIEADAALTAPEASDWWQAGSAQRLPADIVFAVALEAVGSDRPVSAVSTALRRLRSAEAPVATFTWLIGVVLQYPIRLDNETDLRYLTPDEIARCRAAGVFGLWDPVTRSPTVEAPAIVVMDAVDQHSGKIHDVARALRGPCSPWPDDRPTPSQR